MLKRWPENGVSSHQPPPYNDLQVPHTRMTTLIISLPPEPADTSALFDFVLSPDGRTAATSSRVPLALLPTVGSADEVVAVVPAQHLSWHQVQLPKGTLGRRFLQESSPLRVRAILEGLLEDRLLDETQTLHFALAPQAQAETPVWVAVCDRAWLQSALQALEQSGHRAARIVPAFAPDALHDTLYVMGEPDAAQLVLTNRGGVTVWPLSKASVALLGWPESAPVVAEPAVAALAEQFLKRSIPLQQSAQQLLQAAASAWDLAQFDLVNSSSARTKKQWLAVGKSLLHSPRWRAARFAVVALLAVNLIGLNVYAWKQQTSLKAQRAAIGAVLTGTFPKVPVVVDAPVQMAREVASLQQGSGMASSRDLEAMLGAYGAVAATPTVPGAVDFVAGELRLKGFKLTPEDASAISFKLKPLGYGATLEGDSLVLKQGSGL